MSTRGTFCRLRNMQLPLVPADSPVLHTKAKRISDPASVKDLVADLFETMVAEGGVGLAAPQVGQGVRVFVTGVKGDRLVFINPALKKSSDEQIWWEEGCLSLPRLLGEVRRPKRVTMTAVDLAGKSFKVSADDLLGRVLQHELDHLDGILFPDRMEDLSKLKRLTEAEWASRYEGREGPQPDELPHV